MTSTSIEMKSYSYTEAGNVTATAIVNYADGHQESFPVVAASLYGVRCEIDDVATLAGVPFLDHTEAAIPSRPEFPNVG